MKTQLKFVTIVKLSTSHYGRGKIPRVSQASSSAKNRARGKANLSRVLHSGKNSTRGREALPSAAECLALGKERHSAKALFPECNTRGRAALGKEKCYLTVQPAHAVKTKKKLLCRVSHPGTRQGGWLPRVPCHGTRQWASLPSARKGTRGRIFFLILKFEILNFSKDLGWKNFINENCRSPKVMKLCS